MLTETVRLAIEALSRNALRSALTGLGIMIGVGAVIAMISIGQGASSNVRDEIAKLGSELLTLTPGQQKRGGQGATIAAKPFDIRDVDAIRREVLGLRHVAPLSADWQRIATRNINLNARIIGTENSYFYARGWKIAAGRSFSDFEAHNGKPVCIIGETVRRQLFAQTDPAGEALRISGIPCTVIGVLESRGQSGTAEDDDNTVAVPFDLFQRRIQGSRDVHTIAMAMYPSANMDRVKANLSALMRERRGHAAEGDNFVLLDMRQVAQSMTAATRTMTLFLGSIAAVSLLVGGIGIMNIMLVSVTERTREIGVRLAIGALPSQIRLQFLCEASLLTFAGGALGIIGGLGAAALAAPYLGIPFVTDMQIIIVTLITAALLGIGFGFAPASRAAALNPVEALRHA